MKRPLVLLLVLAASFVPLIRAEEPGQAVELQHAEGEPIGVPELIKAVNGGENFSQNENRKVLVEPKRVYRPEWLTQYQKYIAELVLTPPVFKGTINKFNACDNFQIAPVMEDKENNDFVLAQMATWMFGNPDNGQLIAVGDKRAVQTTLTTCTEVEVVSTYYEEKHHSVMALMYWKERKAMVVAVRGEMSTRNWLLTSNYFKTRCQVRKGLRCGWVHSDTFFAYKQLTNGSGLLKDLVVASKTYKAEILYFTGHGIGGAVASLAAVDLVQTIDSFSLSAHLRTSYRQAHLATFGSPMFADEEFIEYVKEYICGKHLLFLTMRSYSNVWAKGAKKEIMGAGKKDKKGQPKTKVRPGSRIKDIVTMLPNVNNYMPFGNPVDMDCRSECGGEVFSPFLTHLPMTYVRILAGRTGMSEKMECPISKLVFNPAAAAASEGETPAAAAASEGETPAAE